MNHEVHEVNEAVELQAQERQNQALENAKRILGEAGCASKLLRNAPIDWAEVQRGRDLFVPGWGGFDIEAALELCNTTEDQSVSIVPSVQKLRSSGYLIKFFSEIQDQIIRDRIQRVLQAPESLLSRYIIQHRSFWADARNANRLDEIEAYWLDFQRSNPSRALKEDPKRLLNRLARDRAVAQHPLIKFQHLLGQQSAFFDEARILLLSESLKSLENWSFELSVLEDSHSVLRAAQELNNCAADYVRNIRQKRCALIVLRSRSKLLAMGEWDLHSRRWSQISEHSDEPVRDEWLAMYRHMAESSELFQVRCVLPLPEVELGTGWLQEVGEDAISTFSVEGATDLEQFCNASIFGMQPCFGWPSLLQRGCHTEACGALLLWTVASAFSNDCDLEEDVEEIVDRLLCQRADPDTMTDGGWNSLMFAVMAQKTILVGRLLEAEADIDARAVQSGRTPLMLACSASVQNFGLVCRLVTAAASLDFAARIDGRTALLQAVEAGAWSIAEFLLQANADMNAPRFDGKTVLMLAVESNRLDFVRALINQRAELNLKDHKDSSALSIVLETKRSYQKELLHILVTGQCDPNMICPGRRLPALSLAASTCSMEVVEILVQSRADLNVNPSPVAAAAAAADRWQVVRCLVELGAAPDGSASRISSVESESPNTAVQNSENGNESNENAAVTPVLILAVKAGEQDLVEFLCSNGASPNLMDDTSSACGAAAAASHLGILKLLAEAQADLDCCPKNGLPALLVAAHLKRWPAFHLLLELRANPDVSNMEGQTAMIIAASQGNAKAVSSLIERKARMESRCRAGQTALIAAARQQSWMAVRRLAEARANLDAVESSDSKEVILRLAETSQWDTLIHLARHGANLEVRGQAGRTVLMYAAECGLDDVAWWLLKCRADPNAQDNRGETALLKACNRQLESFMRLLWEAGASSEIAVQKSRIPAMSRLLQQWNGDADD